MLSRYLPAQNLQIEFLNKWRNQDKYPSDDIFAPRNYSFDYLFAITMFAQPLAWFEGTGLPSEAFATSALIRTYRQHSSRIHAGNIFPIGNEPDGRQWTGFQSIADEKTGYMLVFREDNPATRMAVPLLIPPGKQVTFTRVAGSGKTFRAGVSARKSVPFELPQKNSFGLYQYTVTP
ncbi:hypothetical protein ACO2Q8_05320 [Larkinella sp. VNQ87]|uniref:hypothetical protein n=1 Tax=Larkinella sp. VNQ87 TaxID=3400921 RepID=UPI003C060C07